MTPDDAPAERFDLDQFLPYRLNHLADRISQALARLYETRHDLTVAQWRVLAWLHHREELTAKQIREATRMDKARVSRAVQGLEARELIRRRPSPEDQRRHELRLTAAGEALLAQLIPEARAWEAALVAPLSIDEYRQLFELMSRLESQLTKLES